MQRSDIRFNGSEANAAVLLLACCATTWTIDNLPALINVVLNLSGCTIRIQLSCQGDRGVSRDNVVACTTPIKNVLRALQRCLKGRPVSIYEQLPSLRERRTNAATTSTSSGGIAGKIYWECAKTVRTEISFLDTGRHRSGCDEHKRRGEPVCFALCHGGWGYERRVRFGRPSGAGRYDEGEECEDARGDFLHKQPLIK
jgi:hypothetical protein